MNPLLNGERYGGDNAEARLSQYPPIETPIVFDNLKAHAVIDQDPGDEQPEQDGA